MNTDEFFRITPRLHLRPTRAADADAWVRAHVASALEFDQWMPRSDPSITFAKRFDQGLARAIDGARQQTNYAFVAEHLVDHELIAFCSLSQIFRGPFQNAFAGWRVSTPYVGQGLGREAVTALLDLAFNPSPLGLGLHRVQANVIPTNRASVKLARAVGFREEGYAVKYLEIDGRYQDHVMFAKLAEEHASGG